MRAIIILLISLLAVNSLEAQQRFDITAVGPGPAKSLAEGVFATPLYLTITYSLKWQTTGSKRLWLQYSVTGNQGPWISARKRNAATQELVPVMVVDTGNSNPGNLVFRPEQFSSEANAFIRLVDDVAAPSVVVTHVTPLEIAPPPQPIAVDSVLRAPIKGRVFLSNRKVYGLDGYVFVDDGGVLEIEAGTVIVGDTVGQNSAICVNRGGIIIAKGTAKQPIVMTSSATPGARRSGDWGGLLLCGRARVNTPGGQESLEGGIADNDKIRGWYGGNDDNDSSGVVEYVRIEFAGIAAFPNEELNSLSMGAIGRRTIINHVQCSYNNDDAFEWWGGTADAKYLVAYKTVDDDLDGDRGFTGRIQHVLVIRDPQVADQSTSQSIEMDNFNPENYNQPYTAPIISNLTAIGPIRDTSWTIGNGQGQWSNLYGNAAQVRRNARTSIVNSVFAGWPRGGIELNGSGTQAAAQGDSLLIRNNRFYGIKGGYLALPGATVLDASWLSTPAFSNHMKTEPGPVAAYLPLEKPFFNTGESFDPRPKADSELLSGASFAGTSIVNLSHSFFDRVDYVGAFGPDAFGVIMRWDLPWCEYNPVMFNYQAGGVTHVEHDEAGNKLPSTERLDVAVYPNPAASYVVVRFNVESTTKIALTLSDISGAHTAALIPGNIYSEGMYDLPLNLTGLPQGAYMIRISSADGSVAIPLNISR